MQQEIAELLPQLLTTSSELAEAATADEWSRAGELQVRQAQLVQQVFERQGGQPLGPELVSTLQNVHTFTQLVNDLAVRYRSRLVRESSNVHAAKSAASAYEANSLTA